MDKVQQDVHEWVEYSFFDTGSAAVFDTVRGIIDEARGNGFKPERVLWWYLREDYDKDKDSRRAGREQLIPYCRCW